MTVRLTLLVHGATSAQRVARVLTPPDGLEPNALRLGKQVLERLGRVDHGWCSPYRAARDTATGLGLGADTDPMLRDLDLGRWKGRALAAIAAEEPDAMAAWLDNGTATMHGGETLDTLFNRVETWLGRIGGGTGRHVAVTHASVARAAIALTLGGGITGFRRVDPVPLCLVRLDGRNGEWTLRSVVPPERDPRGSDHDPA